MASPIVEGLGREFMVIGMSLDRLHQLQAGSGVHTQIQMARFDKLYTQISLAMETLQFIEHVEKQVSETGRSPYDRDATRILPFFKEGNT